MISATQVKLLRDKTGAGIMDCKQALVESQGDLDEAISILRKKGQKVAAKRTNKETLEGVVLAKTNSDHTYGVLFLLSCETDFVAETSDFLKLAELIIQVALSKRLRTREELLNQVVDGVSISDRIIEQIGIIGEKITLAEYHYTEGVFVSAYIHPGNRLSSIVTLSEVIENMDEVGKFIAMQVASMNPYVVHSEDISKETLDKEEEIAKEQLKETLSGKSPEMVVNILKGRLAKFAKEISLTEQPFIMDDKKNVKQYLKENSATLSVKQFYRCQVGS